MVKNPPANTGDGGSIPGSGRFPWRRKWQPTSVFLPEKFHGQSSLEGYSLSVRKESDKTEQLSTSTHIHYGIPDINVLMHTHICIYIYNSLKVIM